MQIINFDKMIKRKIALIFTIYISILTYGQIEKIDTTNGVTNETFSIDFKGLKQGEYKLKYKNRLQVEGSYSDGLKNGKWIYQPDKYFKLIGFYKSDKKDSIWSCYFYDTKYSTQNYITGEKRSYYPSGKLRTQGDSIDGKYQFIEYSKRGKIVKKVLSDSIFTDRKEFDKKGNLVEHIISKGRFPFEIIKTTETDKQLVYGGDISNGNGLLQSKIRSYKTGELYLSEKLILSDSRPNGKFEKFNEEGKVLVSGQYQDSYMISDWIKYDSKTFEVDTIISYSLGDSIENDFDNKLGTMADEVFIIVENMPAFNGESYNEFRKFIGNNLQYPKEAAEMSIQGRVFVQFAIDWNGKLVDAKIVRGVDPLLDNEALRVVNLSPYWRPGMQRGVPVKVQFTFPISFMLD